MNDWNIVDWTWDEHMLRARMQFGAFWPAADEDLTQELGHDGQGAFNSKSFCQAYMCGGKANCTAVLEGAGLNRMLRKNDVCVAITTFDVSLLTTSQLLVLR